MDDGARGRGLLPVLLGGRENQPPLFSEKGKQAVRPTVEIIIDHRKGTDGWYVACSNNKCNRDVFLSFKQATASRSPKKKEAARSTPEIVAQRKGKDEWREMTVCGGFFVRVTYK